MLSPPPTPPRKSRQVLPEQYYRDSIGPLGVKIATIVSILSVIIWGWVTFDYSNSDARYQRKLSRGWLFGRLMDNSDSQYSSFRNNIPVLILVLFAHQVMGRLLKRVFSNFNHFKIVWNLCFSVIFLFALFGLSIVKIWLLSSFQYILAKQQSKAGPLFSWIFAIGILFLNHAYSGYKFGFIPALSWMDSINGIGMRWHVSFNFCILRMVSFSMDHYWMNQKVYQSTCKTCDSSTERCQKCRAEQSRSLDEYGYWYYMCYILYAPLYLAGPIISYNNFIDQINNTPKSINLSSTISYGIKWIGMVLLKEIMMHLFYVVAIKDTKSWDGFTSLQIFTLGYFNLNFIWIKLTIIWRFFRLWAMADGIETQENMTKCMSNHYSGIGFWRNWHTSYNKWLLRYIYIPLGGSESRAWNSFVIFTFVAIWHDIELKLLAWGWLITFFIIPEMLVTRYFCSVKMRDQLGEWHIHLCAFGGVLDVFMMMTANLVGFAVGVEGMVQMARQILQPSGILFILSFSVSLFAFVHVMFAHESMAKKRRFKSS